MTVSGKITKINSDLQYGFIKVPKIGDVFFSLQTQFQNTNFESLKLNDSVKLSIVETERGLFAETLQISSLKHKDHSPEVTI